MLPRSSGGLPPRCERVTQRAARRLSPRVAGGMTRGALRSRTATQKQIQRQPAVSGAPGAPSCRRADPALRPHLRGGKPRAGGKGSVPLVLTTPRSLERSRPPASPAPAEARAQGRPRPGAGGCRRRVSLALKHTHVRLFASTPPSPLPPPPTPRPSAAPPAGAAQAAAVVPRAGAADEARAAAHSLPE